MRKRYNFKIKAFPIREGGISEGNDERVEIKYPGGIASLVKGRWQFGLAKMTEGFIIPRFSAE